MQVDNRSNYNMRVPYGISQTLIHAFCLIQCLSLLVYVFVAYFFPPPFQNIHLSPDFIGK